MFPISCIPLPLLFLFACQGATTILDIQDSVFSSDSTTDSSPDSATGTPGDSDSPVDSANPNATFTLALFPDTQAYVESDAWAAHFAAQAQWVVDSRETEGIDFVSQLGDIVSHGGQDSTSPGNELEWNRAVAAMAILDAAGVPWSTAVGNHELDQVDVLGSGYTAWAARFGPETTGRFDGEAWFGGYTQNELSSWQTVRAGGVDFLLLHLELDVPDTTIAWAEGVMSAHPGWPTIVSTHSHRGPFSTPYLGGFGRNSLEEVRKSLLGPNPQIFLVVNGHHGVEQHGVVLNDLCHPVLEMSLDYSSREEGGMGWTGLLEIDPASGTLTRRTYSPVLDDWEEDADSAFTLEWDWQDRFSGESASTGEDDPAVTVDDYSSDSSANYTLSDSYGTGGSFEVRNGEMILVSAPNNTVAAVLTAPDQRMEVGQRWGVTNPTYANVMFMVSSVPHQPDGEDEYGFRFRRDGSDVLRIERYDSGTSLSGETSDPGGSITLWIERLSLTSFAFSVTQNDCGRRVEIGTYELPELVDHPSVYVGLQGFNSEGGESRFDDLRVAVAQD